MVNEPVNEPSGSTLVALSTSARSAVVQWPFTPTDSSTMRSGRILVAIALVSGAISTFSACSKAQQPPPPRKGAQPAPLVEIFDALSTMRPVFAS